MSQTIRGQGGNLNFPIGPKNTNCVDNAGIFLPVNCRWISFSGCREKCRKCLSQSEAISDLPENHKLGRGRRDIASEKYMYLHVHIDNQISCVVQNDFPISYCPCCRFEKYIYRNIFDTFTLNFDIYVNNFQLINLEISVIIAIILR